MFVEKIKINIIILMLEEISFPSKEKFENHHLQSKEMRIKDFY